MSGVCQGLSAGGRTIPFSLPECHPAKYSKVMRWVASARCSMGFEASSPPVASKPPAMGASDGYLLNSTR